jgi:membrane-associated phospholipid phosphatase
MGGKATNTNAALELDTRLSKAFYDAGQRSGALKLFATILTLSGDEAICYPATSLVGFIMLYFSTSPETELIARRILRIYGDFGAVCLFEQIIKAIFKRTRPPFKKPSTFLCMPFEQYSFPSGHTMRAAYAATIFLGPHSPLFLGAAAETKPSLLLHIFFIAWAIAVAASRVILSKHFLSDVTIGAAIGVGVAQSSFPTVPAAGVVRFCLASAFSVEIITVMASSKLRKEIQGWPFLLGIVVVFWCTFPFAA